MLRNAIASSRSSHVFDLTRVTSAWGRRMTKGKGERGIALRTKREREREKRPSKYYLELGTVSSGWYPTSVGCNASRFRSRSSFAEPICPAVKKRDDVRQREPERDGERTVKICIHSCASYLELDTLCRRTTRTDRPGTSTNDERSADSRRHRHRHHRRVSYVTYQNDETARLCSGDGDEDSGRSARPAPGRAGPG